MRTCLVWLCFVLLFSPVAMAQQGGAEPHVRLEDADGDGLPDAFEQALLERFLPRFFVSRNECSDLPAEFALNEPDPRVLAANGTIYAQAFPVRGEDGEWIELHYFHLWAKDCGRWGHPLDVEHVSALLAAPQSDAPAANWRALYWFAAAHENTVCDVSHGAQAKALDAEERGAKVWISRAKHASYLNHGRCKFGCGGDECPRPRELDVPRVVNLGQAGRPLHGALFIASSQWPMADKLDEDFSLAVRQQLAAAPPKKVVAVNSGIPPVRATILAGEEILGGVGTGKRHTEGALKTGKDATGSALGRAFRATGRFLSGEKASDTTAKEQAPPAPAVPSSNAEPATPPPTN
ncbi:MAG: hypothetical protein U5J83_12350 [Bryobacterales bacterium]|nr:hypothetical protein [Bryobacterales bacterium]